MKQALSLADLLKNSERLYIGKPDKPVPFLKWDDRANRDIALLFRFKHVVDARAERMEYIGGLSEFVHSFKEHCNVPFELDPTEAFDNWPADPFEDWIGKAHRRFTFTANLFHDQGTYSYTAAVDVGGVIDMDLDEYRDQYAQALLMQKMAQ